MSDALPGSLRQYADRHGLDVASLQAALDWQVLFWSGEQQAADQERWRHWLNANADHRHAWEAVARMAGTLGTLSPQVAHRTLKQPAAVSRRRVLGALAVAGLGSMLMFAGTGGGLWQRAMADYRCARGEQQRVRLEDGSSLILNTASAVSVDFGNSRRRITLAPESEIALDTRPSALDDTGPLALALPAALLSVQNTWLTARDLGQGAGTVGVLAGRAQLVTAYPRQAAVTLNAGQQAHFDRDGLSVTPLSRQRALAWTRGVLQADRWRLADFLDELSRYRDGVLYCDDEVADLIVSGAYPLKDTDYVLESLARALPVAIHYRTPWLVRVGAV
ncbi:FecR-like transmembrane sensor, Fe2+-dicitrate sensor [Alloalcanivorax dieselolei B5]|uniref:FecR-like transmembrane sensor, Fe2+-dicitrate sensor n=1 Tax=Alcanivorax dieselolei (strain DSM 16502 / CGMCC 1.3690 / MCCC 1A00001 / B-5) TaxID=930169 RepID=K0CAX8_ALCDB|nr:DUF4880 domain-containing protein [Alloalcanivorax dieselolei]AFT68807.1 FecR-like transmembrane sensor, Fe2+-dicitrate sensor [Alloalcanivorax dieselolei B5]GGK06665.1 membrane protein [Alloalcanivorax dieselolei]